jgi:tetratricopeptide (TPR) repeat protein
MATQKTFEQPAGMLDHYLVLQFNPQDQTIRQEFFHHLESWQPQTAGEFFLRGTVYVEMQKDADALADFSQGLQLNQQNLNAHRERAMLYMKRGQFRLAVQDFNYILERQPKNPKMLVYRANCFLYQGQYQEALADARRAGELEPELPAVQQLLNKLHAASEASFSGAFG